MKPVIRRRNSSKRYSPSNESDTSLYIKRVLCSPYLLLLVIVGSFVFIGVILINDMNQTKSTLVSESIATEITQYPYSSNSNKPLRIILSMTVNIEPQRMYLFFSSFRRWHPQSDKKQNKIYQLYAFTKFSEERYLSELQRLADYFGVTLVDMDAIEDILDSKHLQLLNIKTKYIKINKRRFFILFEWLKAFENTADIDAIFLSDGNDVKFQGNIFTMYDSTMDENRMSLSFEDDIFWFFMENPDVMMNKDKWNKRYIKYCFGNESVPLYKNLHVSCSGTSLATYKAMYYYLEIMNEILIKQGQEFHDCLRKPGDQAIHNIILHKELLLDKDKNIKVVRVPNDSGWILQITSMINHPFWSKQVPKLAEESMVVHQWKWAKTVKTAFEKEYNYATFCYQQGWDQCTISK